MFSRQRLFWLHQPYDLEGSDPDFLRAVRDNCAFHMARCPEYRAIADHIGFSPEQIQTIADLARLPVLPTLFYKRHAAGSARWALTGAVSWRRYPWSFAWAGGTA